MLPKPKCCLSLDISFQDLIFPDKLDARGKEFIDARDLGNKKLGDLVKGAVDIGNNMVKLQHRCPKLDERGACSIYENRPAICRDWVCEDKACGFCDGFGELRQPEKEVLEVITQAEKILSRKEIVLPPMYDLSILIPARSEMFLARTIQDILEHIEANTEVIAVLDGVWDDPKITPHERVNVIYVPEAIGQRAATNIACNLARGKYVMKVDAHCAFDQGFDRIMLEGFKEVGDGVTMVPLMRNLWAFDWKCYSCGKKTYQGPTPTKPCDGIKRDKSVCGAINYKRKMLWIGKHNPSSWSYCFDSEPHFQYFEAYKHRPGVRDNAKKTGFSETMSLQGSCFMATKEKYQELNLCDESLGSWGNQGIEVACRTWLSGGRVLVNHRTWYAHMFRTQGGDFSFPYDQRGRAVAKTKKKTWELFTNGGFPHQIHPVSWLVEKFWPIKGKDFEFTQEALNKLKEAENAQANPH